MKCFSYSVLVFVLALLVAKFTIDPLEVIGFIITSLIEWDIHSPFDSKTLLPEYDFIIVGAGTAGCVLANRLSENPKWNVLLIEAGSNENSAMDVPLFVHFLQLSKQLNWGYKTVSSSDSYCLAMENNQCKFPRGKVMGGSSVINYMMYTRGNKLDFDNWARNGADGWSFNEVLPFFEKFENSTVIPNASKEKKPAIN